MTLCYCGHAKEQHENGEDYCEACPDCVEFREYSPMISFTCEIRAWPR